MFVVSQISIDVVTVTLVVAIITLAGTLVVTILNATWLETRRQLIKRKIEKKALHDALYSEMAWTVSALTAVVTRPTGISYDWNLLKAAVSSLMNLDVYKYTRKEPTLFYELNDAHPIELFYQWVVFAQLDVDVTTRQWSDRQLGHYAEPEAIRKYKENVLKKHIAWAIRELDIDELKGRLFITHAVMHAVEKDPRDFVDELVILMQKEAAEEHTQETAAPTESEKEKT